MWEIEGTDELAAWFGTLDAREQTAVDVAVEVLSQDGPSLGCPLVDTVTGSRYANMKELRPLGTTIRILFAFDPRRSAILLLGGDKAGQWTAWYEKAIPAADALYAQHLEALREEGLL